jgi:hypothetical protein
VHKHRPHGDTIIYVFQVENTKCTIINSCTSVSDEEPPLPSLDTVHKDYINHVFALNPRLCPEDKPISKKNLNEEHSPRDPGCKT